MTLPTEKPSFGVFDGVRVVYSVVEVAAPTAAAIMTKWGADATQIENAWTGDPMRDITWMKGMERRNMRSISMNPSTEDGKEALCVIIKDADILIESGKGPMYARKGITDELLWGVNSRSVIVYVPGFGQWDDEERVNSAACDLTVAAYADIVTQNGSVNQPINISSCLGDYINSLMIISSALVALHRVGITGEGESIDMTMYETLLRMGIYYTIDCMNADILYPRPGTCHQNLCGIGTCECEDGFIGLCLYRVSQNKYLLETIGLGHLWGTEEYLKSTSTLWFNGLKADLIQEALEEYLKTQSKFNMQCDFTAYRIAAQVVNEFPDILATDYVRAHGCLIDSEKADGIPVKILNTFPRFRRNPGAFWRPMPALGEDTRGVLKRAGYSDEDVDHLVESGTVEVKDED